MAAKLPRRLILPLLALLCPLSAVAAGDRIELELWCDLDPIVQEGAGKDVGPIDPDEAIRRMLDEARTIVSAMVYGCGFSYTPSDEARRVDERFDLTPRAEIPWGDPRLTVASTRMEERRLHALFRYELGAEQQAWRAAWQSGSVAKAAGEGIGNVFLGQVERGKALTEAIKESIRNHLRQRVPNKPHEVRGELLLWEVPGTYIDAGAYHTRVVTRLRIAEVTPYKIY